ncbi:winged helix-turn-helix domain-containing protein [uncultured Photobacterium sp.]|uniref:winged helix-turn-helix domain-containing protein n=1 Tax=uncultured Photobacterium sp. TaxID=173973 RepID=UPI002638725E|nr:winged helix-turn-helix domain-containing protein [uncultured Photobacterium sp.]
MSSNEQIKFRTEVYFIPSLGIIQSADSTQKLNLSEQNILTFLINNHRPVTKGELLKAGWPDRIVSEASLFQVIRALRVKLQERRKGDVIETLPRVGYQITQFERLLYPMKKIATDRQKRIRKQVVTYSLLAASVLVTSASIYWKGNHFQTPAQINFLTETEAWDNNKLMFIASNQTDLNDIKQKLSDIYREHTARFKQPTIQNIKAYAYKGHDIYSVAWCQVDKEKACLPNTDFAYTIEENDWEKFSQFLVTSTQTFRESPIIQTDMAREPTSQVYMNYMDDSGIQSKIVHYYISNNSPGNFSYSYMSFITEKETDFHHALSVRAATISVVENHSPFLATAELKPDMFHWAYQPNDIIIEDKSTALMTESRMREDFKKKRIVYSYLLYQQPFLNLVFYADTGIYWVNNSTSYNKLFNG